MSCVQKGEDMNEAVIRTYAELMKELELTAIEITEDNTKVRLERAVPVSVREATVIQPSAVNAAPSVQTEPVVDDGCISVKSNMVGVFYASPAENADPFVSIGDHVKKGQTLCIIEAMKLMNELCAEESGVIEKICVTNGQVVEFGTELFRIRRK